MVEWCDFVSEVKIEKISTNVWNDVHDRRRDRSSGSMDEMAGAYEYPVDNELAAGVSPMA